MILTFIEVTVGKEKVLFNISEITKVSKLNNGKTRLIISSLENAYDVEESYEEIRNKIQYHES